MEDFSKFTLEQLFFLRDQIDELMKIRQAEKIVTARRLILSIAKNARVPIEALINDQIVPKRLILQRFRHPDCPDLEWGGRGRHPKWMKELLDSGKSIDDLRVTESFS
jgi:DNA-binding protein H-NS